MIDSALPLDPPSHMIPPWSRFPDIPMDSIVWRMGEAEGYKEEYISWYQTQDGRTQAQVRKHQPAPGAWAGFYGWLHPIAALHNTDGPTTEDITLSRCKAAILGALAGDAAGVPFEFKAPEHIPAMDELHMVMPATYDKTYSAIPYGTWSDDGAHILCLLETLQEGRWFAAALLHELPEALGSRLLRWMNQGYHQSGGLVYDCGGQTSRALHMIEQGVPALQAGGTESRSNGNGSLMRVMPVAIGGLLHRWALSDMVKLAHLQSCVTHAHPIAQACCALYCVTAIYLHKEGPRSSPMECMQMARDILHEIYHAETLHTHLNALAEIEAYPKTNFLRGSGYVVDSLWTAIDCLDKATGYTDAVRRAISHGNDTDTTACIAGGLAGLRFGMAGSGADPNACGIPQDWIAALRIPEESAAVLGEVFSGQTSRKDGLEHQT